MEVTKATTDAKTVMSRRRWTVLFALLCGTAFICGGWIWWTDHRYKRAMAEIESEVLAGRYAIACRKLNDLLSWNADRNGGIVYLLGSCELARGREEAAGDAWARVVPGSEFWRGAIRARMRLLQDSGRLAAAEQLISTAAGNPRNDPTALLVLLVPIYGDQGRVVEAEQLIKNRWAHLNASGQGALEPAIKLLLQHIELTWKQPSVDTIRAKLDHAARLAPDDDRVWLGRANLALQTGAHDEAERWLDKCLLRRPNDVPVWRARLRWAMETKRIDVARQAMTHLPALETNPPLLHRLDAWIAAHDGDVARERRELELLVDADPADTKALDRLAVLAQTAGQNARAAELRRKNEDVDRWRTRYLKLHERKQPIRDAVELARLAEQLGRRFEARGFRTIAIFDDPALAKQLSPEIAAGQ